VGWLAVVTDNFGLSGFIFAFRGDSTWSEGWAGHEQTIMRSFF